MGMTVKVARNCNNKQTLLRYLRLVPKDAKASTYIVTKHGEPVCLSCAKTYNDKFTYACMNHHDDHLFCEMCDKHIPLMVE